MHVDCVVGARPNFIKIAPLLAEMDARAMGYRLIHTGQHYDRDMSEEFFEELGIPSAHVNLGVGSSTHGTQTALAMMALEKEFLKAQPDLVIVVGDVNSTLAGALAAAKLKIPVAHVEAGYRSFDKEMPEEINRIVVDHVAEFLFAPTKDAAENLVREGVDRFKIHFVGNIMAETLLRNLEKIRLRNKHIDFGFKPKEYALATVHRPENTDGSDRLRNILQAFSDAPLPIVFPLHPRTRRSLDEHELNDCCSGQLIVTKAFSYLDTLSMLLNARLVLTDSGGVQEEACVLGVPCITVRKNTERITTVAIGANRLAKAQRVDILGSIAQILEDGAPAWLVPERWDQHVSRRILRVLEPIFVAAKAEKHKVGSKWSSVTT